MLSRTRTGTADCPEETIELTGSTGNIYTVHIGQQPRCDCPHAAAGHQCKHWLYVGASLPVRPVFTPYLPYEHPLTLTHRPCRACSAPSSATSSSWPY